MKIGDKTIVKVTGIEGKIVNQIQGFWVIQFSNNRTATYATNKLAKYEKDPSGTKTNLH